MMRKVLLGVLIAGFLAVSASAAINAPVRLARTPDYHAGKIVFSTWATSGSSTRTARTPGA